MQKLLKGWKFVGDSSLWINKNPTNKNSSNSNLSSKRNFVNMGLMEDSVCVMNESAQTSDQNRDFGQKREIKVGKD